MENIKIMYHTSKTPLIEKIEQGDWIDLYSAEDIDLEEGEFALISLGISVKLPKGYEAHLAPRSSTFIKWGIIQTNSIGVIDESYCGNDDIWKMPVMATRKTHISAGDKICQFRIIEKMPDVKIEFVNSMDDRNRGGFGSTGAR